MITYLYASLLGFLYFYISFEVIRGRRKYQIALGSGDENEILHLVSAHSNFSNYVPFFLLLLFLIESENSNSFLVHSLGFVFLSGRILHILSMKDKEQKINYRKTAMMMTFWPLLISCSALLYLFFFN